MKTQEFPSGCRRSHLSMCGQIHLQSGFGAEERCQKKLRGTRRSIFSSNWNLDSPYIGYCTPYRGQRVTSGMEMVEMHTTIVCSKERHMTMTRMKITLKTDHALHGLNISGDQCYDYQEWIKR